MEKPLIPEIISRPRLRNPNNNNLEISVDNRKYSINHHFTQNNTSTNITNVQRGGVIYFLIGTITLPFKLIYRFIKYIFIKYDIKNKIKIEGIRRKKEKFINKFMKSSKSIWDKDEIF